jgi:hypothetical protein
MPQRHADPGAYRCNPLNGNRQRKKQDNNYAEQAFQHRFGVYRSLWTPRHGDGSDHLTGANRGVLFPVARVAARSRIATQLLVTRHLIVGQQRAQTAVGFEMR